MAGVGFGLMVTIWATVEILQPVALTESETITEPEPALPNNTVAALVPWPEVTEPPLIVQT